LGLLSISLPSFFVVEESEEKALAAVKRKIELCTPYECDGFPGRYNVTIADVGVVVSSD